MAKFLYEQTVDLKNAGPQVQGHLRGYTEDARAHTWVVRLVRGGAPENLEGFAATATHYRADGEIINIPGTITDNVVTVTLPEACYAHQGMSQIILLRLSNAASGENTVVAGVWLNVEEGGMGSAPSPADVINGLDYAYVTQYGTLGVGNDRAVLQAALDNISGKCLLLPTADIDVGANDLTIIGASNFALVGDGVHSLSCKKLKLENCSHFSVSGLSLEGKADYATEFLVFGNCHNFDISRNRFFSATANNIDTGIHVYHNSALTEAEAPRDFRIHGNTVYNTRLDGILVHAYCKRFSVIGNTVHDTGAIGIEIEGRFGADGSNICRCKQFVVSGNTVYNCLDWSILVDWCNEFNVLGNTAYDCGGTFLALGCIDGTITGNVFRNCNKGFEISSEAFDAALHSCDNLVVTDNQILGCLPRGANKGVVQILTSKNIQLKNNVVKPKAGATSPYGIYVGTGENIDVEGNHILDNGTPLFAGVAVGWISNPVGGAALKTVRNVRVAGNHIENAQHGVWQVANYYDGAENLVIEDNYVDCKGIASAYGISLIGVTNCSIVIRRNTVVNADRGYSMPTTTDNVKIVISQDNRAINCATIITNYTPIPATGTWQLGDKRETMAPAAAGYMGYVCTAAGTMGTLNSGATTGSINSGSTSLTVSSATGLAIGQYITIAGVTGVKKIINIVGTTVIIDSAASATVSGAAVAFSPATWKGYGLIQS